MQSETMSGNYDSYLLRIWRGGQENEWRWMLQNIRTGEQRGFRDLAAMVDFLNTTHAETQTTKPELSVRQ